MANASGTRAVFINGLVPWTRDLSYDLSTANIAAQLSDYTKSIMDFDHRDDQEIVNFVQQLQHNFKKINQDLWVNIFNSMQTNVVDIGPEGHHPGILSHQLMADQISNYLTRN
jgi:hypothetical protein